MGKDYLLSEKGSDYVFAVISGIEGEINDANIDLMNKVGLAVEEQFCYEELVKLIHGSVKKNGRTVYISFNCIGECDEEEIRDLELTETSIY